MKTTTLAQSKPINILFIGNNPTELSVFQSFLMNFKDQRFLSNTFFSAQDGLNSINKEAPGCIVIDDNLAPDELKKFVKGLHTKAKTRDIPLTLLKSSNYRHISISGIEDYLLKEGLSAERLTKSIINAIKMRNTRRYLQHIYKKRTHQLKRFFN